MGGRGIVVVVDGCWRSVVVGGEAGWAIGMPILLPIFIIGNGGRYKIIVQGPSI